MKDELDAFLAKIPNFEEMTEPKQVRYVGFFLSEILSERVITPKRIRDFFHEARVQPPSNISYAMSRSGAFIPTKDGYLLGRSVITEINKEFRIEATAVAAPAIPDDSIRKDSTKIDAPKAEPQPGLNKNVMVVYGRDQKISDDIFSFLRALKLNPIEWSEAVRATGKSSPYVGEILDAAFGMAQAVLVLLTPDENVQLRRELCADDDEFKEQGGLQPRANVLIEAGMALARNESRTILVKIGSQRPASDLEGRHVVKMNNSAAMRNELANRLKNAGCDADMSNQHWLRVGFLDVNLKGKRK